MLAKHVAVAGTLSSRQIADDIANQFSLRPVESREHENAIRAMQAANRHLSGWLVGWSLTALSTQCRSYRAFKVRLY